MNRADLTRGVLLYEQLAAAAKAKAAGYREELSAAALRELEDEGVAPSWKLPTIARVVLPVTEAAIVVTDRDALTKWVAERYPEQVHQITLIRPAYEAGLTKRLGVEDGQVFDPASGEIVPGVELRAGGQPKTLTITPTDDAKAYARQLADGLLERYTADLTGDGTP